MGGTSPYSRGSPWSYSGSWSETQKGEVPVWEIIGKVSWSCLLNSTEPDPQKVKAVQDFPTPTSASEVRCFLGMASYYWRFVNDFASISAPLHDLTKGQPEFCWSPQADKAFTTLKHHLCSSPVLALPNFPIPFTIYTDSSDVGLGAVLAQRIGSQEHVIAYASRALTSAEKNYSTTEKECLAIVWSVNYWRTYLLGKPFNVVTDHQCFTWLQGLGEPKGRLARWILYKVAHKLLQL